MLIDLCIFMPSKSISCVILCYEALHMKMLFSVRSEMSSVVYKAQQSQVWWCTPVVHVCHEQDSLPGLHSKFQVILGYIRGLVLKDPHRKSPPPPTKITKLKLNIITQ